MKEYTIHCNEEELGLLLTAVELQMRMRLGQGFAVCENLFDRSDTLGCIDMKEAYEPILDLVLRKMTHPNDPTRISEHLLETQMVERDMWAALNDTVIGAKEHSMALGKYGLMKIEEAEN